ncbi:MAG: hypothetical protein J7L96_10280 [Bacteroidales bacterium]|nr:hypothetical protein [Bacteroidales bacterium]
MERLEKINTKGLLIRQIRKEFDETLDNLWSAVPDVTISDVDAQLEELKGKVIDLVCGVFD